jgi:hypothetical protein
MDARVTKERPILFQGAMVRAILAGTKAQTRRLVKYPAAEGERGWHPIPTGFQYLPGGSARPVCPYGRPGDRLWVRETWAYHLHAQASMRDDDGPWVYAADGQPALQMRLCDRWRPSIHMPRCACRLVLEITDVRVERLRDISEADAMAEGIVQLPDQGFGLRSGEHYHATDPRQSYLSLWESINGEGSVEANPWVWAVSFRRAGEAR